MVKLDLKHFLAFEDWLGSGATASTWVVVAQIEPFEWAKPVSQSLFTFSALTKPTASTIQSLLSTYDWEVHTDLGMPTFERRGRTVRFDTNWTQKKGGVSLEPFTLFRRFNQLRPSRFEIVQAFSLYHNLYWSQADNAFRRAPDEEIVVRLRCDGDCQYVEVKGNLLRDYLAAVKLCLVRYHDHRRMVDESLAPGISADERAVETPCAHYSITVSEPDRLLGKAHARLVGKDVILPLKEPIHDDYRWLRGERVPALSFIVAVDGDTGLPVEEATGPDIPPDKSLTPVFFRRSVLRKYYRETKRYRVTPYSLTCLNLWSIEYAVNREGLLHVWLGDLVRLPPDEQMHWRSFNVSPSGELNENFFRQQILNQWVEVDDPAWLLLRAMRDVNEAAESRLGFKIFLPLAGGDAYISQSLRVPLDDEPGELDEQIQCLAKLFNDSINKASIVALTGSDGGLPLISQLEALFSSETAASVDGVVQPFRTLQALRSAGVAHRKGANYAMS